jgi:CheY-like chemotaxis protein
MQIKSTLTQLPDTGDDIAKKHCQQDKALSFNHPHDVSPGVIMVVEDDMLNQVIARKVLTNLGYQVIVANNGQEGMDKLASADIDLILMDMQMPVMDGPEATRRIRAQDCQLPILGFTANTSAEAHQACLDAGMHDVLTKPIQIDALSNALDQFLKSDRT